VAQAQQRMNGRGHGGQDGCGCQNDGHGGRHWNDNAGGHNLVLLEQIIMREDKVPKLVVKVMLQVEIMVLSMVMDFVMEHIVIDYFGCRHCLLVLFMDLSKR
jgi:hypothetical protein